MPLCKDKSNQCKPISVESLFFLNLQGERKLVREMGGKITEKLSKGNENWLPGEIGRCEKSRVRDPRNSTVTMVQSLF